MILSIFLCIVRFFTGATNSYLWIFVCLGALSFNATPLSQKWWSHESQLIILIKLMILNRGGKNVNLKSIKSQMCLS